jgi:hypothetical protein
VLAVLATLLMIGVSAPPASAHAPHPGLFSGANGNVGCAGVNVTEDYFVEMVYTTSTMPDGPMRDAMLWNRQNNLDPTDLQTQGRGTWNGSVNQYDVIAYNADYEGGQCQNLDGTYQYNWCQVAFQCAGKTIGLVFCQGSTGFGTCNQQRIYLDSDFLFLATTQQLRALACHETGHAIGLEHIGGTCMTTPIDPGQIGLSGDQRSHINAWY